MIKRTESTRSRILWGMNDAKQDVLKTIERLGKEIVTCQNAMEAGRPCLGMPADHKVWLHKLQTELFEAEAELAKLDR